MRGECPRRQSGVHKHQTLAASAMRPVNSARVLDEVFESLPQGVVMFDAEGRILFVNRRYSELYGFSPERCKPGLFLQDLFILRRGTEPLRPEDLKSCDLLLKAIARKQVVAGEMTTGDGKTVHYINTPLPSGGWIVTHEDVTNQRRVEAKIEHMASHDV